MIFFPKRYYYICLIPILISTLSCSFLEKSAKAKKETELKKKNYAFLYSSVASNSLQIGMSSQRIEELFGKPDDVFASGSMTSNFQIWKYEKVMDKTDEMGWQSIQLYFDNNKLLSWKY